MLPAFGRCGIRGAWGQQAVTLIHVATRNRTQVDVHESPEVGRRFGLRELPAAIFFRDRLVGARHGGWGQPACRAAGVSIGMGAHGPWGMGLHGARALHARPCIQQHAIAAACAPCMHACMHTYMRSMRQPPVLTHSLAPPHPPQMHRLPLPLPGAKDAAAHFVLDFLAGGWQEVDGDSVPPEAAGRRGGSSSGKAKAAAGGGGGGAATVAALQARAAELLAAAAGSDAGAAAIVVGRRLAAALGETGAVLRVTGMAAGVVAVIIIAVGGVSCPAACMLSQRYYFVVLLLVACWTSIQRSLPGNIHPRRWPRSWASACCASRRQRAPPTAASMAATASRRHRQRGRRRARPRPLPMAAATAPPRRRPRGV